MWLIHSITEDTVITLADWLAAIPTSVLPVLTLTESRYHYLSTNAPAVP